MLLGVLILTLLFTYSFLKNIKRKRLVAQQKHTIETQRLEKLLKEQELEGIDAIIEAQEKERDKIANDLHDNLGSKITTLKLYIEEITANENYSQKEK
jgi:signal transduction histidine kinase